ncbi:cytochrome c oxidase subunit VIb [Lentinula edodes]|uniref:Cytochrome c oxidase subunit n=2 Tax=Lentinula TaxID=5352 RepID=A0A1Q3ERE4_LENED|nr:cytochrome c oxidase, subunit VIb [Lentinula edodes]GAW09781.1 cytochrome c oxidase subunit VIb [Lentinula edodes]
MSDSEVDIVELRSKYVLKTVPFDARFPNQNQTRNCFQNYTDYFKCVKAKGEDFAPCQQFLQAYKALCPNGWTEKWDAQRESGTFPASLEP